MSMLDYFLYSPDKPPLPAGMTIEYEILDVQGHSRVAGVVQGERILTCNGSAITFNKDIPEIESGETLILRYLGRVK